VKVLVKVQTVVSPDLGISIGLKNTYHEFEVIEDAMEWIFKNKNQIESYELFSIEKFATKKEPISSFCINKIPNGSVNINSGLSYGEFR